MVNCRWTQKQKGTKYNRRVTEILERWEGEAPDLLQCPVDPEHEEGQ